MPHVHALAAGQTKIGMNTGIKGPSLQRQHGPNEVVLLVDGSVAVYGKANANLSAGAVAVDQTTVAGQNTLKEGSGYVIDKAVALNEWYWAKSTDGGIGPMDDAVPTISFTAGANNVSRMTITWKDAQGNAVAGVRTFRLYVSDVATGISLHGSFAPSGTLVAASGLGAILATVTAKKDFFVSTNAAGVFAGDWTDTAESVGHYIVAVSPSDGELTVSAAVVAGNWG